MAAVGNEAVRAEGAIGPRSSHTNPFGSNGDAQKIVSALVGQRIAGWLTGVKEVDINGLAIEARWANGARERPAANGVARTHAFCVDVPAYGANGA